MSEIASSSQSRPTAPSMPSTTPSPTPHRAETSPAASREGGTKCPEQSPETWRRAWDAGAPTTGRPRRSAGSRSSLVVFALGGMAGTKPSTRTSPGRVSPVGWIRFSTRASSSRPARASSSRAVRFVSSDPAFAEVIEDVVGADRDARKRSRTCARRSTRRTRVRSRQDEHAALVEFEIRGDPDDAADKIAPVLDRVDIAQQIHPEFFIGEFGDASAAGRGRDGVCGRSREGRPALAADHLAILVIAFGRSWQRAFRCSCD